MNESDPYHTVVFRLLESFTPHVRYIFQQNFSFSKEKSAKNIQIDNNEIFKIFPRRINNYSSMLITILKIINCSPSFFLNDISLIFDELLEKKNCNIMKIFEKNCQKIEGVTTDFCFCFTIIFLTDLICQILIKYEKSGFTSQNVQQLIECGIKLIEKTDNTPLKTNNKAREMVFNQFSVINSILSEKNFEQLTIKYESFLISKEKNITMNAVHLLRFIRLDLNPSQSSDFLLKILKIIEIYKEFSESFLKSVLALLLTAPSENISPFYSFFESKPLNQENNCFKFMICLLMLRNPTFSEKPDGFFEKYIYPDASNPEKVEQSLSMFLFSLNSCEIDPRVEFWEWGVFKRSPTLSFLRLGKKKEGEETKKKIRQSISNFMKYYFSVSDFSVCPKLFSFALIFLASSDFENFLNTLLPQFLQIESTDSRFITLLMIVPLVNSSDFAEYSSSRIEQNELNRFNSLLREKILKSFSCLQINDKITAVSITDNETSFSRVVEESDKIIYETLKNWNLTQFTEINVHHMKSEEKVQVFSLEVQLLRSLPFIMNELDQFPIYLNESIMLILLKLTFSLNASIALESLSICRTLAIKNGCRFVKVIINYLLEHSPSSESLFNCISIINDAVTNQISIFRRQNRSNEIDQNLFCPDILHDIEFVSFIAVTSYHPITRQIAYNILTEVNELLNQKGIFSFISKMTPSIEKVVKRRLFSYSLTYIPSQDQGILPSGLIQLNTALCSHFFDIWSVFLSELINVIIEANYLPIILRFKSDKLVSYIKERIPMVSTFFLSAFFVPEFIESISHNYKYTSTSFEYKNDSYVKNFIENQKQDKNSKKKSDETEQNSQLTAYDHTINSETLINQSTNSETPNNQISNSEELNNESTNSKALKNQSTNSETPNNRISNSEVLNNEFTKSETLNNQSSNSKIINNEPNNFQFPKLLPQNIRNVHDTNYLNLESRNLQKPKRHPLTYSNSTSTISTKFLGPSPLFNVSSKSSRNIISESNVNNVINRISKQNSGNIINDESPIASSSSTFHVLSKVISLFINSSQPSLAFTIILHSHVTLYPSLFDILSSIIFPSSGSSQMKTKSTECNSPLLISEATKTVAISLRNPSIKPIFMIKHLMTHVLKFNAYLQGYISNTIKINGPRVIKWTDELELLVKKQKDLARNYCIIISRLFSIVNLYTNKQNKKKKKTIKRKMHIDNNSDYYYYDYSDYEYENESKLSEKESNDDYENDMKYDYDYDYEYDLNNEKEDEKEVSSLIEENWPISNREIVFRFLINWSTTTSEELQNLREHAAAALSVIVRIGPLFCDTLLIDISALHLFSSLEQDGTSILEPLLFNHIDLLIKSYIRACYTEPRNSADIFFEALYSTFEVIRKKYTDINSSSTQQNSNSFYLKQKQKQSQNQKEKQQTNKKVTFNLNTNLSLSDFDFAFQEKIGSLLLLCLVYIRLNHPRAIPFLESLAKIITASIYNRSSYSLGFNSSKKIEEMISNGKNLIQTIHIMFAFATETVIESGFSTLSLSELLVPQKEIIEVIRPWISNLRLLPKQRNCVPGIPTDFERFTPYQFLEVLMKTTEIIDDENFTSISSLWSELMKSPDHSELIPLFICKWNNPETNKKLLFQLIQTDAPNIVKRLALHCSFAYYYYEFTSEDNIEKNDQFYYDKMWFLPLITEAFKNQNEELIQHIPTVVHFAFLFNDVMSSAHQLLEVLCQQFSINLKHYINSNNNEYQEYLMDNNFSDNNSVFELTDDILIPVVREFSCILSQISEEYIQYWGKEALKWLFGCRSLRIARISLTIFNQIMRPIEPLVISGICKTVSFHVSNSPNDINNLTKLVGQSFVFYNAIFERNEKFSFEYAASFLDCKIFVDSCLKSAAQLFMKSLSSKETNARAWQSIIGIVRPLLNKLEKDELNQKVIDLLIKTSQNQELMMIVAPIKIISPHLFTSFPYECFEDLLNSVSDIVMCKSLVHYATMTETASTALLNSIYHVSTQIVSKVVKNENNRSPLCKIYKSALYNLCVCDFAIDFISVIANIEPSVATKSVYEFYDWNRSLEDVSRSLVRLLSSFVESTTNVSPITDCSTIQSVYNLLNCETVPKILPFVAQQEMMESMKRVRRVINQKRRHSLKKSTLQQQNVQQLQQQQQQQQYQINQDQQQQLLNDISWDFEPLSKPDKLFVNSEEFKTEDQKNKSMELQEFAFFSESSN